MRFNAQELSFLAHLSSDKFDKQGYLHILEKPDSLFRKGQGTVYFCVI